MIRALGLATLMLAGSAQAFTISMDFDSQSPKERCEGLGSGKSYVSNDVAATQPNACMFWIKEGKTGWGTWGGTIDFPRHLVKGDAIWVRWRVFMPVGFDYTAPGEGGRLKYMRVRTREADGSHIGYDDIYLNGPDKKRPFGFIYEGVNRWIFFGESRHQPRLGKWETYEWYMKFSDELSPNGAVVRFWKNGALLLETDKRKTLKNQDAYAEDLYLGTYWNGASPKSQSMYVDDIVVTTDRPANRDDYGNAFVGVGTLGSSAPQFSISNN